MPKIHDYVIDRFPELRKQVLELRLSNREFADTCADYNEICDELRKSEFQGHGDSPFVPEFRRLRDDLEADLMEALATHDQERT